MGELSVSWPAALAWRLGRHLLQPVGDAPVEDVVRRLTAVPTMDAAKAELAVRTRRRTSEQREVAAAVADGRLVQAFAFRGAVHVMAADDAGAWLALRSAGRQWELKSWREHYGLEREDWPPLLEAVRAAVADVPRTLDELGAAVTRHRRFRHLQATFDEGAGTLMKPLFWQGAVSFGPPRDGRATLRSLDAVPGWTGVWDLDDAGPYCIAAYLGAYGPASTAGVHHWLGDGLSAGRRRIDGWLAGFGDRVVEVDVEGRAALVLREHAEELEAAEPTDAVRFVPGHDGWVMGPGTQDEAVVPPELRDAVTRKADLVLVGGVVRATWTVRDEAVAVTAPDPTALPTHALEAETTRLAEILDRPLSVQVER